MEMNGKHPFGMAFESFLEHFESRRTWDGASTLIYIPADVTARVL